MLHAAVPGLLAGRVARCLSAVQTGRIAVLSLQRLPELPAGHSTCPNGRAQSPASSERTRRTHPSRTPPGPACPPCLCCPPGAPFTLATYIVEGGSSKSFAAIKRLAFGQPEVLHALLDKLADNVADYVRYQVCFGGGVD